MQLSQQLSEYIAACFTGLWIQSHEHDDALAEIASLCREQDWRLAVWDVEQGLTLDGQGGEPETSGSDPLAAIRSINTLASPESSALLVLVNFHRFVNSAEITQALARQITTELEKQFIVLEHELPGRDQLDAIAQGIATEAEELPADMTPVLDAAAGLTRYEAEGAYSLSLVRHGRIQSDTIWELKTQTLKKSGLVELHRGSETFADLGGLDSLKAFCQRAMRRQGNNEPHKRPRGLPSRLNHRVLFVDSLFFTVPVCSLLVALGCVGSGSCVLRASLPAWFGSGGCVSRWRASLAIGVRSCCGRDSTAAGSEAESAHPLVIAGFA